MTSIVNEYPADLRRARPAVSRDEPDLRVQTERLPIQWGKYWLVAIAAACTLSLLGSTITYLFFQPRRAPLSYGHALLLHAPTWTAWVLTVPLLVIGATRFPLERAHLWRNAAVHVCLLPAFHAILSILTALLIHVARTMTETATPLHLDWRVLLWIDPVFTAVLYVCFLTIVQLARQSQLLELRAEQQVLVLRREAELVSTLADTKMHALRLQLHPHFLFNALNTVGALVVRDPQSARSVLAKLSDLLRDVLRDDKRAMWTIEEETAFLQRYVDIQKLRFRDVLDVSMTVDERSRRSLIPRLLLQPLVENAIQHGSSVDGHTGVAIAVTSQDGWLIMKIRDRGQGFGDAAGVTRGIGIANTRERLAALDGAALETRDHADGGAEVTVRLRDRQDAS